MLVAGSLALPWLAGPVLASPGGSGSDPSVPSQAQVDAARAQVSTTAGAVAVAQAQLDAADAALVRARVVAGQAVEAYDGAVYRSGQAQAAASAATQRSREASAQLSTARQQIGQLAATTYQMGGDLSGLAAFLSADGPQQLIDELSSLQMVAARNQKVYDQVTVATVVAGVATSQARAALSAQALALAQVTAARDRAQAALNAQTRDVAGISASRTQLIARLASLQHVSVALEQARQRGLAAAAAAARQQAAAAAAARQQAAQQGAGQPSLPGGSLGPVPGSPSPGGGGGAVNPAPSGVNAPSSGGISPGGPATSTASQGLQAVSYAYAQLGKPYVWGAAGPDAFDCSGLTMRAWQAAGVSLAHWTVAQYEQTQPVSLNALRPGDLIFYASNLSDPSTIYHVGLYVGNGQMIAAPYTGAVVRVESIQGPDLFGAGRP